LSSDDEWLFWIDGQPKPANDNDMNWALNYVVEPDYLRVMGIPLKSGRFFSSQDDERGQKVAVVDEALAGKFFPGGDAVGQRLHINSTDQLVEIVGVVGHVKQWSLDADQKESLQAQLYTPFMQLPDKAMAQSASGIGVLVRSQNSAAVFDSVRRASTEMSYQQVVFGAQSMNEIIGNSLSERRFSMILLGIFALAALGAGAGLVAAVPLARLMRTLLFSIGAADPLTYFSVLALLMSVSLAACSLPAYRAARMNPVDALRYE